MLIQRSEIPDNNSLGGGFVGVVCAVTVDDCPALVNYRALPRSGLLAPRLSSIGLPVSVSELIPTVGTGIPDSAGDFASRAVRSDPLIPVLWILAHNQQCALCVALEYRQKRGKYRTIQSDKQDQDSTCID